MTGTKKNQISGKNGIVPPLENSPRMYVRFVKDEDNGCRIEDRR